MSNISKGQIKEILSRLAPVKNPAPLGYISLKTEIEKPFETLEKTEDRDLVRRRPFPNWSSYMKPTCEIVLSAKEESANAVIVEV